MNTKQFTKQVNQIDLLLELIESKNNELKEINAISYYEKFNQNNEKNRDTVEVLIEKKDLLSNLYAKLESLQTTIELLKSDISNEERKTIKKRESFNLTTR
jgi:hypothetical protein